MYMYMYICAWSYDLNMYNEPLFKDQVYFGHTLWPYGGFFVQTGPRCSRPLLASSFAVARVKVLHLGWGG